MKNFWNKYKILIIIVMALGAFITLSVLSESITTQDPQEVVDSLDTWKEAVDTKDFAITVIGLTTCSHCKNYKPVISSIAEQYSLSLYWFDIDALSNQNASILSGTYDFTEYDGSSPYTAITSKGEVVDQTVGEMDEEATLKFLRDNGVIE